MDEGLRERIEEELVKTAADGRLSCAQAFALAEKLGVRPRAIGEAADNLQIRIVSCQLGLFK